MNPLKPLLLLSNNLLFIFLGIFGIGFIIGFHELGHFLFGKLFKIKTPSFAIGFGPKIYRKQIGETEFSIGTIPLGGYVESDKKSFESKPYYQKLLVMAGGMAFNMLFAYIIFCLIFMLGIPKTRILYPLNATSVVQSVAKNPEIEKLNLKEGDRILAINSHQIGGSPKILFEEMEAAVAQEKTTLEIERKSKKRNITVPSKPLLNAFASFGIILQLTDKQGLPLFGAIKRGVSVTNAYLYRTLLIFKYMFVKRDISHLGGPIAVISETIKSAGQGLKIFLLFLAIISISLVVLNLIPLPILDGGQIMLYTIEAITRRQLSDRIKEYIFIASWIFMLILFVLLSARDIWRIIYQYLDQIKNFGSWIFGRK